MMQHLVGTVAATRWLRRHRSMHGVILVIALAATATACSDSGDDRTAQAGRLLADSYGVEVELPERAERVITTQDTTLANVLALGVRPVATAINPMSIPAFLRDQIDGIENIAIDDEPGINLERLVALEPDLVLALGGPFWEERCEQIRAAAPPTYCYSFGYATMDELRTNMTDVGRALGIEDAAQEKVDELDGRVAALAARVADEALGDRPVSVLRVFNGSFWVICSGVESALLRELGIARPAGQQQPPESCSHEMSLENTAELDAYGIYVFVDTDQQATMEQLESNPLWQQLEAVRNDRVWLVEGGTWNGSSLPAAHGMLDDIEATFLSED
jgi:iron complex transport system substrate-binding protein